MEKEIHHFKCVGWVEEYAKFEELLITFLCEEGIYFQFFYNLQHHPNVGGKTLLEVFEYIKNGSLFTLGEFLDVSITWAETKEGHVFWKDKSKKFYTKYCS